MLRIDVYLHIVQAADDPRIDEILTLIGQLTGKVEKIMPALDDLKAEVETEVSVEQSAIVLLNGLGAKITAAGTDPAALAALTAEIKQSSDALAAAVVANTQP